MRRNSPKLSPQAKLLLLGITAALWVHSAAPSQAHGAKIEVLPQAVEIVATFDTGEPMDNAQVAVYAPDTPDTPWRTGQTDSEGRFSFTPDAGPDTAPDASSADGLWEVTVRKAGHGQMTSFSLGEDLGSGAIASSTQTATAQPSAQKWLSMAAVIWGFVGTALYFSSRSHKGKSSPKGTGKPPLEADRLDSARTVDNRATVAAGLNKDGKATAEEYR